MIMKLLSLAVFVMWVVGSWRMHEKAGQSGWVGLIPVINILGLLKMIGRPYWWAILYLVPVVNVIVHVVVMVSVAKTFGRSALFGLLMAIPVFTVFGIASLGLGGARYLGPSRA